MYWSYPSVDSADRLEHAVSIDPARVRLSPHEAAESAGVPLPAPVALNTFDGRPVYRFASRGDTVVYADTGERQRIDDAGTGPRRGCVDRVGRRARDGRDPRRCRPVDHPGVSDLGPAPEIFMAVRRTRVCVESDPARSSKRRHGVARWRLSRADSPLALRDADSQTPPSLECSRDRSLRSRDVDRPHRPPHRSLEIFAVQKVQRRWNAELPSLPRAEALARYVGTDLRRRRRHLVLQRHAVDGPVSDSTQ